MGTFLIKFWAVLKICCSYVSKIVFIELLTKIIVLLDYDVVASGSWEIGYDVN